MRTRHRRLCRQFERVGHRDLCYAKSCDGEVVDPKRFEFGALDREAANCQPPDRKCADRECAYGHGTDCCGYHRHTSDAQGLGTDFFHNYLPLVRVGGVADCDPMKGCEGPASPLDGKAGWAQAAFCWLRWINASRSALIWSALVVGMPCGNPGYTFRVAPFTSFADCRAAAAMGTIWSSSPCMMRVGTSNLFRSSVKSVSEKALMQS